MLNRKKIMCTLLCVSLIASLAACTSGGNTAPSTAASSSKTEASSPSANDTEDVTLRFSWWGGDARHEATIEAIDYYMEQNPNVMIEAEYGGFDGYQQKISTQLAGGTSADIMQIDQPWMADFTAQGDFFVDIGEYSSVMDVSGFDQKFLNDFCVYNGKLVSLPTGLNGISFLANKAVMEEAGVIFSDTISWEDLLNEGKKVNAANPDKYMINMDRGISQFITRIYLYQLTGKPLVNDDYTIAFTKEELIEAYEFTQQLYADKVVIPLEEALLFQGSPQDNPGWNSNQYGGWFNWASTANLQDWGDDAVALPYPILPDAKQSAYIVRPSQVLGVSKSSKNAEAALTFLDYFFNSEEAALILKDCRSVPPVEANRNLLSEQGLVSSVVIDSVNLAMSNVGDKETLLSTNAEVVGILDTVFEKLIYKQYDAQAAADEVFVLMQDVLDNLKASNS